MSTTTSNNFTDTMTKTVNQTLQNTESVISKGMGVFEKNSYLKNIVLVLLILYAPLAAPMVGKTVVGLLNNYAVKFVYIFVLAYLLSNNIKVSFLTSIVLVLGIYVLKKLSQENMEGKLVSLPENIEKKVQFSLDNTNIPSEPVVDRTEVTKVIDLQENRKSTCGSATLNDNSLDNLTEYNALANHSDSLQPLLIQNPFQPMDRSEIGGYDESDGTESIF